MTERGRDRERILGEAMLENEDCKIQEKKKQIMLKSSLKLDRPSTPVTWAYNTLNVDWEWKSSLDYLMRPHFREEREGGERLRERRERDRGRLREADIVLLKSLVSHGGR